jgi:hypothetical protein
MCALLSRRDISWHGSMRYCMRGGVCVALDAFRLCPLLLPTLSLLPHDTAVSLQIVL